MSERMDAALMPEAASTSHAGDAASKARLSGAELELRLDQAWRVLSLNQELARSADLRAYLLSFMSTMLVTFVANNVDKMLKYGSVAVVLLILFFVAAIVFFFFALATLTARAFAPAQESGLVFFGDIASRGSPARYVADVRATDLNLVLDDILRQTHHVATIARKKYATYRFAWVAVLCEIGCFLALQIAIALAR
jgi:hypothetical protein